MPADSCLIRLKKGGETFEILTVPGAAFEKVPFSDDVLVAPKVLRGSDTVATAELEAAFGTADHLKVAAEIYAKGDVQVTVAQRKKMVEEKRVALLAAVAKNYTDAKSKLPVPMVRLEQGYKEAKFSVKLEQPLQPQVEAFVKALQTKCKMILVKAVPLEASLHVGFAHVEKVKAAVRKHRAKILDEDYGSADGCVLKISYSADVGDALMHDVDEWTN
jgi:ribosome maturation protein Sdo1